ncbi:MAG: 1-phosphofructokinase [Erysipelotrichaceae bacterium]|nr:1-phosphofructokinase [Erysipelotrichaceae bacterium]MDY6034792.1 1-phosphofructokinase [Bulleidia sp.]
MIYTLTLNPSLDYIVQLDELKLGDLNRSIFERIEVGGKGINVSIALKHLGRISTPLGFVEGFTGDEIEKRVRAEGLIPDFVKLENGDSRINIKLKSSEETEINACGPSIEEDDFNKLYVKLEHLVKGDILIMSGSLYNGASETVYADIMKYLEGRGIRMIVDAKGTVLKYVLTYKPYLIKPNLQELSALFDTEINTDEVIDYARKLVDMGVENVLVSMGSDGAALVNQSSNVCKATSGQVLNSAGAGDAMLAAFIASKLDGESDGIALKRAVAMGSATAFSYGIASKEAADLIYASMEGK